LSHDTDIIFLRRAIELSKIAREQGQEPFGAVLVKDNQIVHESINKIYLQMDPTAHAENSLIREFCQKNKTMNLAGFTLYCSTEPCMMCLGAILRVKISRVVFSITQENLHKISGGSRKIDYKDLINSQVPIEFAGPMIIEEGLKVFEGYTFGKT
jgi:tRNA(Arg) A34 adenosine deaminase TadA